MLVRLQHVTSRHHHSARTGDGYGHGATVRSPEHLAYLWAKVLRAPHRWGIVCPD